VDPNALNPAAKLHLDPATGSLRSREFRLEVLSAGADQGKTCALSGPLVIGSGSDAGFRISDTALSRHHLEVQPFGDGVRVRDLASMNGTFVGGARVEQFVVYDEATFSAGRTLLRVWSQEHEIEPAVYTQTSFGGAIGISESMRQLFGILDRVSATHSTVLLVGEQGAGKQTLARAVHTRSRQFGNPFVVLSCASATSSVEGKLFGRATPGGKEEEKGAFLEADGGTLFLDDIGELPLEVQLKLLRTLESARVKRLGEDEPRPVNVRLIAASPRELQSAVEAGRFREELYFRLAVVQLRVPPLRQRKEDVPLLVRSFLAPLGRPEFELSKSLLTRLDEYGWPGNVRELQDVVERALLVAGVEVKRTFTTPPEPDRDALVDAFAREYFETLYGRFGKNPAELQKHAGISTEATERLLRKWQL
jgi:DNA-binding NtrC family response regulator